MHKYKIKKKIYTEIQCIPKEDQEEGKNYAIRRV